MDCIQSSPCATHMGMPYGLHVSIPYRHVICMPCVNHIVMSYGLYVPIPYWHAICMPCATHIGMPVRQFPYGCYMTMFLGWSSRRYCSTTGRQPQIAMAASKPSVVIKRYSNTASSSLTTSALGKRWDCPGRKWSDMTLSHRPQLNSTKPSPDISLSWVGVFLAFTPPAPPTERVF
jgi:hypothetical protein